MNKQIATPDQEGPYWNRGYILGYRDGHKDGSRDGHASRNEEGKRLTDAINVFLLSAKTHSQGMPSWSLVWWVEQLEAALKGPE